MNHLAGIRLHEVKQYKEINKSILEWHGFTLVTFLFIRKQTYIINPSIGALWMKIKWVNNCLDVGSSTSSDIGVCFKWTRNVTRNGKWGKLLLKL